MISIGDIGFHFRTKDEDFTRRMYVRWDDFFRKVLQEIIEEVLSRQDEEGELIRLDRLELDLGNIPQKDFYEQFPVRLREELERAFSYQSLRAGSRESEEERVERRLATLLFYLEKGFCPTVWEDAEFHLGKEMDFLLLHAPQRLAHLFHDTIRQPSKLDRLIGGVQSEQMGRLLLLWVEEKTIPQDEKERQLLELEKENYVLLPSLQKIAVRIPALSEKLSMLLVEEKDEGYMSWLLSTVLSVYEKRRSLARLLETRPVVVIRFIHEASDEKSIRSLAGLLDKVMVRQIIDTESENHTEVDVPDYWMYLYNWLIKNYPFNGVYMFGNKMQFKEYLNVKLLHFIRKRLYSAYLSKAELTVQFLLEVFGHEYYREVLNIIYNQQQRNEDGSPVYTGYFNMELYYMFLRLSLINLPAASPYATIRLIEVAEFLHAKAGEIKWLSHELMGDKVDFTRIDRDILDKDVMSEDALRNSLLQENAITAASSLEWLVRLRSFLKNDAISLSEKRRVMARWMEVFRERSARFVKIMKQESLLADCVAVMDRVLLEQPFGKTDSVAGISFLLQEDFVRWLQHIKNNERACRLLFERHKNKPAEFIVWLKLPTLSKDLKRKIVRHYTTEYPYEFLRLLRQCPNNPAFLSMLTQLWSMEEIVEFISRISIFKAEVLSHMIEILQQKSEYSAILKVNGKEQEEVFARALLLYLWDARTFEQMSARPHEILRPWVLCLQVSYTGKATCSKAEKSQWKQIESMLAEELRVSSHSDMQVSMREAEMQEAELEEKWVSSSVGREDILHLLSSQYDKKVLRRMLAMIMDHHSELLVDFLEKDADQAIIRKLAGILDHVLWEQLVIAVSVSGNPLQTTFFRRMMAWLRKQLIDDTSEEVLLCTLIRWMREGEWRDKTQEEIRAFFFLQLQTPLSLQLQTPLFLQLQTSLSTCSPINNENGVLSAESSALGAPEQVPSAPNEPVILNEVKNLNTSTSSTPHERAKRKDEIASRPDSLVLLQEWNESVFVDWLKKSEVSIFIKQSVLHQYLILKPGRMLSLVRELTKEGIVSVEEWTHWFDEKDWARMVAGISLYKAELLEQVIEYLLAKPFVTLPSLQGAIVRFLIERSPESWIRETNSDTVKYFVKSVQQWRNEKEVSVQELTQQIISALLISDSKPAWEEELSMSVPEYIFVGNAGVVLLSPWFPRLFGILGLLNEKQKDFKDMASRIRAVFIIQRLVTFEEREYEEKELAFNRILVGCPFSEPLPAKMELTEEELQVTESMLNGVKENWTKLQNTSIRGFQYNFIERSGQLEQKEGKWILTVDPRPYDMLLDSVPWSYNRVRFPWLKKQILVSWRTKQEF